MKIRFLMKTIALGWSIALAGPIHRRRDQRLRETGKKALHFSASGICQRTHRNSS